MDGIAPRTSGAFGGLYPPWCHIPLLILSAPFPPQWMVPLFFGHPGMAFPIFPYFFVCFFASCGLLKIALFSGQFRSFTFNLRSCVPRKIGNLTSV
ncbi:hypothetical protein B0H11DRAFT_2008654 [Mycena galericulata]|nr:hypothetical protein B0H11DRAFT_2008654 [Mycena galericulata]